MLGLGLVLIIAKAKAIGLVLSELEIPYDVVIFVDSGGKQMAPTRKEFC